MRACQDFKYKYMHCFCVRVDRGNARLQDTFRVTELHGIDASEQVTGQCTMLL